MKIYQVTILGQNSWTIDITGENEQEVRERAIDEFMKEPERLTEIELVVDDIEEVK